MKISTVTFLVFFVCSSGLAQRQRGFEESRYVHFSTNFSTNNSRQTGEIFPFSRDIRQHYRPSHLTLSAAANNSIFKGQAYWMDAITTQSYNQGKVGTYYLWDVQGNMRESRMFLDIAGKNRRGLKLIFRRR